MLLDTNVILKYIRANQPLSGQTLLSVIVAAELEVLAARANWGASKKEYLQRMQDKFPPIEITGALIPAYTFIELYSQGKLPEQPLEGGLSARNMGGNDLWIAATALYFDVELHTADGDFDHLLPIGLQIIKPKIG